MWYRLHLIHFRPNLCRIAWQASEKINDLDSGLNLSKHLERMANFLSKKDQAKISLNLECIFLCVTMVFWLRCFKTFHSSGYLTMMLCLSVRQTKEVCDVWNQTMTECYLTFGLLQSSIANCNEFTCKWPHFGAETWGPRSPQQRRTGNELHRICENAVSGTSGLRHSHIP